MKVSLIAEGCYPFVTGGVSTWCDQLVRGLSEHSFEVVAITGTSGERPAIPLPDNVMELRSVGLWDWKPAPWRRARAARTRCLESYRALLRSTLDTDAPQERFTADLRALFEAAQAGDLTGALHTEDAVEMLTELWQELHPSVPLSMREAVEATELVEHLLRPLSEPVIEADIVHAVSNGLPALMALAAKWRYGTPVVMSEHGVYLRERYLSCRNVQYRWPVKAVQLALFRRMCATAYAASDAITPVNVYNQRWEVRHGADPDVIITSYNGINVDSYPAAPLDPGSPTVGWVGRIDPLKDLETLIRSFVVVRREVPDAVLRLFGPVPEGNEWYAEQMHALVEELGLTGSVVFEGPVRPVTKAYHASTIVALSSISEGLPYTVMEAMMCRRATVSTAVGGVAEVVGTAGLVVPPRDPVAFGRACVELLTDRGRRDELAQQARERSLDMFRLEQMLNAFRDVYRGVLGPRPDVPHDFEDDLAFLESLLLVGAR